MALKKISTTSTVSGPGWVATRKSGVVVVEFDNWDGTAITLPWLPVAQARASLSDLGEGAVQPRATANTAGRIFAYGTSATPRLYGQITYLT